MGPGLYVPSKVASMRDRSGLKAPHLHWKNMIDLLKMRRGVLKELKNIHRFLDNIERSVRANNPQAIQRAYMLLCHLVREMDKGIMTPDSVALDVELMQAIQELEDNDE